MPQRVADYFVVAGLDFNNAKSLRLPGEAANQSKSLFFDDALLPYVIDWSDDYGVEYGNTLLQL